MNISNLHSGHRGRVKKEFRENGMNHFPDHKVLEMLLFYTIPRADTNEIAHRLLSRFGSLSGVFDASYEHLLETEGVGEETGIFIKYIAQLVQRYMEDYSSKHNRITDTESAKEYMTYKFVTETSEALYVACLAADGKVVFCDKIAEGSPETVDIKPIDVVKEAIRANAVKVVLAHNHPRGICSPSSRDLMTTRVITSELNRMEIELFDHIIVANNEAVSMRELGMIENATTY